LLERQDIVRAVLLGGGNDSPTDTTPPVTVTGADLASRHDDTGLDSHDTVLSARGLYRSFGGVVAVDDVDLDLCRGEILGLLGPNGAGKTTIFELLSGEQRCERGRITMGKDDITSWPAYRRAEHGLGRSFQAARLWPGLTVHESVIVAISHHTSSPGAAAATLCLPHVRRSERRMRQAADEILEPLGLAQYSDQLTSDLSTGVRRLLELAVIIAMKPSIVLLDEPSAGLAQAETESMAPVLRETKRRLDCSMILIEHDMALLRQLADRAIALDIGAVVTTGTPEDVLNHPYVIESYLGVAAT
jgi:branched-chain amino acid transport system ATP-binding protein